MLDIFNEFSHTANNHNSFASLLPKLFIVSFFNYIFTAISPNINPIIVPMVLAFPS